MKTQLQVSAHNLVKGANVIEIWDEDEFIGTITGRDDGHGVRIFSKYPLDVQVIEGTVNTAEVRIGNG